LEAAAKCTHPRSTATIGSSPPRSLSRRSRCAMAGRCSAQPGHREREGGRPGARRPRKRACPHRTAASCTASTSSAEGVREPRR
jgi:hypothetical protein